MSTNIKVIRYTAAISAILAALTYLISLNMTFTWFELTFFSNNFMLTIFGGAFASMLVVLICEIQKYLGNKKSTEDLLFFHIGCIYAELYIIKTNLSRQQENEKEPVYKELIWNNINNLRHEIEIIQRIDYTRFSKKNLFSLRHKEFCEWLGRDLSSFLSEGTYLAMAVNTDQIKNLMTMDYQANVTATSPYTSAVIAKLITRTSDKLLTVDNYGEFIDNSCKYRYLWKLKKLSIKMATDITSADIEEYIKEE